MKIKASLAALALLCACGANAQERYPSRTVQVIAPVSAGTAVDIISRIYAERLSKRLGQQFIVVNRQGAGGTIAAAGVAKSAPDGYTLFMANSQHSVNPALYDNLPYDTIKDFAGVALVAESSSVVIVAPQLGVKSLAEFIALARQKPGSINYGSAGIGSATHMAAAYFAKRAGISMTHIPYKVSSDITADLMGGRIQANFVPLAFQLAQVREGKLQALAVSSPEGISAPLQIPSVAATAIPGYEYATWYGFLAPSKVPAPVMELLAQQIREISEDPEVKERYRTLGLGTRIRTLREFDDYLKADMERLLPLARESAAGGK
jgi:tripartite-type tricarboxylate transporter receptor subunit TctC